MESDDNPETYEEQFSSVAVCENSLVETVDPSVVEHEMQSLSIVGCEQNLVETVDPPV
ncbi:758_t:CDS:2, partial [Racocetra persica]